MLFVGYSVVFIYITKYINTAVKTAVRGHLLLALQPKSRKACIIIVAPYLS